MAKLTTLARPYARAAFESALSADSLQQWSGMLVQVAGVVSHDRVSTLLESPSLTGREQARIIIDLCGDEISAPVRNFITILSENKRLALLPEIVELFEKMKADQERTIDIDVTTAYPLASETEQRIAEALKKRLQRDVKISSQVDQHLIGGMIVRAGDLVIDGSIRGRLDKLAEAMNS